MSSLTERETDLCLAALGHLKEAAPYQIPDERLRSSMRRGAFPPAATSEVETAMRHLEDTKRVFGVRSAEGVLKWEITDIGRAWYAQNS